MAGHSYVIVTIFGAVFMLAGIGLIISGSVGLYNYFPGYSGSSWALLWAGIGLELIGSTLFAIARRIRWHEYIRERCEQQATMVASVEYVAPRSGGYVYPVPAYSVNGYSNQPLGVPPLAAFPAPAYPGPAAHLAPYEYSAPPISQAPPPYEPPK